TILTSTVLTSRVLNRTNLSHDCVQRRGHPLMHGCGLVSLDEIWLPAISGEEMSEFLIVHSPQHGWIRDLVAIQVKNGQDRAIANRIKKFIAMPACRQRAGFRFAVSDH